MTEPSLDFILDYQPRFHPANRARCRVRVWIEERVAVITEIPDNPGMSVTNAAEDVILAVESKLRVRFSGQPRGALEDSGRWTYLEHYPADRNREATLDEVTFHRDRRGRPERVAWRPAPPGPFAELYGLLSAANAPAT